ncbi:MAG: PorT family protein [Fibrobacter sp.]|nr:PorT family protein [Fibrobacter sp.]
MITRNILSVSLFTLALAFNGFAQEDATSTSDIESLAQEANAENNESSIEQTDATDTSEPVDAGDVAQAPADSVAQDSSAKDTAAKVSYYYDDDDEQDYIEESRAEYRARKEGFSRAAAYGFRAGLGVSKSFLGTNTSGWGLGFELNGGALARLPMYSDILAVQAELDFSYRYYSYKQNVSYAVSEGKSDNVRTGKNKASINEMLFEIPILLQCFFGESGFFIGLGGDISLRMNGSSEFEQKFDGDSETQTESNSIPTVGVEFGGAFEMGYTLSDHVQLDFRVVQNITNMLDTDLVAVSEFKKTKLQPMHFNFGVIFIL